jgi:putative intracellular protease/amidase
MGSNVEQVEPGSRRVLMIVANPAVSPVTGWPVGFWWAEVSHPWWTFREAGYEVTVASPAGGDLVADAWSDPRDPSGYSAADILSLGFLSSETHAALLRDTPSLSHLDIQDFDAVFVTGGQSPMVTMVDDVALHSFVAEAYAAGKVVAVICHGTCILLRTRLPDGSLLVDGKAWTGFANAEEDAAEAWVGGRLQPFRIEDEARSIPGTRFVVAPPFRSHAIRDGRLITGQQQNSGSAAARLAIAAMEG